MRQIALAVLATCVATACSDDEISVQAATDISDAGSRQGDGQNGSEVAADVAASEVDAAPPPECLSAVTCNDGNSCTTDLCEQGACVHVALPDENTVTGVKSPCDDSNLCTNGDTCAGGSCKSGSEVKKCDDYEPCTDNTCNPLNGACVFPPNTATCTDNNACTSGDQCQKNTGKCDGEDVDCEDKNPCTADSCDKKNGCKHTPKANLPCDDNDLCTIGDLCSSENKCVGKPASCGDGNPCTQDTCNPATGCELVPVQDGSQCNDNNACTLSDVCVDAKCKAGQPKNCNDANDCTTEACDTATGACLVKPSGLATCNDNDACTDNEKCQLVDKQSTCVAVQLKCNDGNACTSDGCDFKTGCKTTAQSNIPCDDGDGCSEGDTCQSGKCMKGSLQKNCTDSNPCTTESCNSLTGKCTVVVNDGLCDDGNKCTIGDICNKGTGNCLGTSIICEDSNQCTEDKCSTVSGCINPPTNGIACEDGNACTKKEVCLNGVCKAGLYTDCNDLNPCTIDTCDFNTGKCSNVNASNTTVCDDNDPCTDGAFCANGKCPTTPKTCNDGNPCTTDGCDGTNGKCINKLIPGCKVP